MSSNYSQFVYSGMKILFVLTLLIIIVIILIYTNVLIIPNINDPFVEIADIHGGKYKVPKTVMSLDPNHKRLVGTYGKWLENDRNTAIVIVGKYQSITPSVKQTGNPQGFSNLKLMKIMASTSIEDINNSFFATY